MNSFFKGMHNTGQPIFITNYIN